MNSSTSRLVGRSEELDLLKSYFLASKTTTALCLVSGPSGIGKSSLVNAFGKNVETAGCVFISGKYEESHRDIPYSGLIQALNAYFLEVAFRTSPNKAKWASALESKLHENTKIIIDLIPNASLLFSYNASLPNLSVQDSHNRFEYVLSTLLKEMTETIGLFVLNLDDLQWADDASLALITNILLAKNHPQLKIIGSYRTEEVGISHALSKTVDQLNNASIPFLSISLGPLNDEQVTQILREFYANNQLVNLSDQELDQIGQITHGNPLFITQILETLQSEKEKLHNSAQQKNQINTIIREQVFNLEKETNITDLIIFRFRRLSYETQNLLKLASCLGAKFELKILSLISKLDDAIVKDALKEAIDNGVIYTIASDEHNISYQFAHDRIQDTAYSLIKDKEQAHYNIGNLLLNYVDGHSNEAIINDAVLHLNIAQDLIKEPSKRLQLANLNWQFATQARFNGAINESVKYLNNAKYLLPANAWNANHSLSFLIYFGLYECLYLTGKNNEADRLFNVINDRAASPQEKIKTISVKVQHLTNLGNWSDAVELALNTLLENEFDISQPVDLDHIVIQMQKFSFDDILNLPTLHDEFYISILELLNYSVSAFYVSKPELLIGLTSTVINISLNHGLTKETSYGLEMFGTLLCVIKQDYSSGNEYALLALQVCKKLNDKTYLSRLKLTYVSTICHWSNPVHEGLPILESGIDDGLNSGDKLSTGYSMVSYCIEAFSSGLNLGKVRGNIDKYLSYITLTNNPATILPLIVYQIIENMEGNTIAPNSYSNKNFNEKTVLDEIEESNFNHAIHFYFVNKMLLSVIYEDYSDVNHCIEKSVSTMAGAAGQFSTADHYFYHSLILVNSYHELDSENESEKEKILSQITDNQSYMKTLASACPENFEHKYALVNAEIMSIKSPDQAQEIYETAISKSIKYGFTQDAAIASEKFAKHLMNSGNNEESLRQMKHAKQLYESWGAPRKVKMLDEHIANI